MTPTLSQVSEWARGAGELLRVGYGKQHQVDRKGRIDLVTEMDRLSETYLIERIRTTFPGHTIYSEESGHLEGINSDCWYIDPLDGTTNYAHHVPIFAVSIAYAHAGKMQLGVVYDPMRDECFTAAAGEGAYLNGVRLQVAPTDQLIHSLLVTGFPYDLTTGEKNLVAFAHFTRLSQGVRRLGAAALDLCSVAAGRMDGYWEQTLEAWDMAAGALIVSEAGGIVSSLKGEANYLQTPFSVLASNPALHPLMLAEFDRMRAAETSQQVV